MPEIGVVIAVLNEAEALERHLPGLLELLAPIVVVDNGSTDRSAEVCRAFPKVHLIQPPAGKRLTRGECWNLGAQCLKSEIILFLPIDTQFSAAAAQAIRHHWQHATFDYAAFRIRFPETSFKFRVLEAFSNARSRYAGIVYLDQGLSVRRSVFEALGGFPAEALLEDLKLSLQLRHFRIGWIDAVIFPSSRKFQQLGFERYVCLMCATLWGYARGVPTQELARRYYGKA